MATSSRELTPPAVAVAGGVRGVGSFLRGDHPSLNDLTRPPHLDPPTTEITSPAGPASCRYPAFASQPGSAA